MVVSKQNILFFINCLLAGISNAAEHDHQYSRDEMSSIDLFMPGYKPQRDDDYVCIAAAVTSPGFIVEFLPSASANKAHHVLVYGCNEPTFPPGHIWNCERKPICSSPLKVFYAWARDAPSMKLPADVGVPIGRQEGAGYVVLQVHYSSAFEEGDVYDYSGVKLMVTPLQPKYLAGVYLMASAAAVIPPNRSTYYINISCHYNGEAEIHLFAFRTHTHQLGRVVFAYRYDERESRWRMIGEGNPQEPQRFYSMKEPVAIRPGDVIAAQCVFNSTSRRTNTKIGVLGQNEMCNIYMYYYVDAKQKEPFGPTPVCAKNERPDLFVSYPPDLSTAPASQHQSPEKKAKVVEVDSGNRYIRYRSLSRKRTIREAAANPMNVGIRTGGGSMYGVGMNNPGDGFGARVDPVLNSGGLPMAVVDGDYNNGGGTVIQYGPRPAYTSHVRKKPGPGLLVDGRMVWRPDNLQSGAMAPSAGRYYYANDFGLGDQTDSVAAQPTASYGFAASERTGWLSSDITFGQIASLALDNKGNLVVFHRVNRVWNENSFDETNHFRERTSGPIMDDTVITVALSGNVVFRWGRGFFYMPHGVFIDKNDFLWATDVAMHQVFKFDTKQAGSNPVLTLGTEFEPGVDERHFCKPAAVAVATDGTIFIADGYCNSRIVKFNPNGVFISSWGVASSELLPNGYPRLGSLSLPHSLSLHDSSNRLFVADRENARVQTFHYNGTVLEQIIDPNFGTTVYAVSYCQALDTIFVLNGPSLAQTVESKVFAVDGSTKRSMYSWRPQNGGFQRPHALALSSDCTKVFVGETGPNKVWRFDVTATGRRPSFNAVGKNFVDPGIRKPDTATDGDASRGSLRSRNMTQLLAILTVAIAVPVLIIAAICLCIRFRKRGGFRAMNMTATYNRARGSKNDGGRLPLLGGAFRDRNGFQRLSTEDVDAMDELSDESETEDMLYPVSNKNSTTPQKA